MHLTSCFTHRVRSGSPLTANVDFTLLEMLFKKNKQPNSKPSVTFVGRELHYSGGIRDSGHFPCWFHHYSSFAALGKWIKMGKKIRFKE